MTPVFFGALAVEKDKPKDAKEPEYAVIFPTAREIRESLNGYASGSSIHIRLTSPAQKKMLDYLQPLLSHWASSSVPRTPGPSSTTSSPTFSPPAISAGRDRAAPHIKTYIRYCDKEDQIGGGIDWALLTSANMSKQAWGEGQKGGEVRVCSYEAGVLVFSGMWADDGEKVTMKATFKQDKAVMGNRMGGGVVDLTGDGEEREVDFPKEKEGRGEEEKDWDEGGNMEGEGEKVVALRMPYSLPVRKYVPGEQVWWSGGSYPERDWMGLGWVDGSFRI